jgi:hypothetical protein
MEELNEDNLQEIVIDFNDLRSNKLDEFSTGLATFGANVEFILSRMFGMNSIPVSIRGTQSEISSFAKTLSSEKRYVDTARRLGLDNPRTLRNRAQAEKAAKEFQRQTGVKWPLK